ncbi:MAG: CRISPR system precrRNA processing endoribonuclease RAMP protein Cas6 [Bacteroidia bacterium]
MEQQPSGNHHDWPSAFAEAFFSLTWRTYYLEYEAVNAGNVPLHKSESWRGMLGHVLLNRAKHLYERVFECQIPFGHPLAGRYQHPPNPYIVFVPDQERTWMNRGDLLQVEFTLIGNHTRDFPDLFSLLMNMDHREMRTNNGGVGFRLARFRASPEENLRTMAVSDFPGDCRIRTITPLRLRKEDCELGVIAAGVWFRRIAERLTLLAHFHCDVPFTEDFSFLESLCEGVIATGGSLRWEHQLRYSSRYGGTKPTGGFSGSWKYEQLPVSLRPILQAGELLHVGKATVQGLGKYVVEV